jgi:ferredoxin-like protein FixX
MVKYREQRQRIADLLTRLNLKERMDLEMQTEEIVGYCPSPNCFTSEKTLTIDISSGSFHCTACGVAGPVAELEQLVGGILNENHSQI